MALDVSQLQRARCLAQSMCLHPHACAPGISLTFSGPSRLWFAPGTARRLLQACWGTCSPVQAPAVGCNLAGVAPAIPEFSLNFPACLVTVPCLHGASSSSFFLCIPAQAPFVFFSLSSFPAAELVSASELLRLGLQEPQCKEGFLGSARHPPLSVLTKQCGALVKTPPVREIPDLGRNRVGTH